VSATGHLGIKTGEYDRTIATLIPHYRELLGAAAVAVDTVARRAPVVVDLGTGSGAMAQQILKVRPKARVTGVDADTAMLLTATRRLRGSLRTITGDFELVGIPPCDVVSASFALHHVPTGLRKSAIYKRAFESLHEGGMLVSADCFLSSTSGMQRHDRRAWLDHLQRSYTRRKAENFLKTWAKEDYYFTLEREVELLKQAGFTVEIPWRKHSFAVVVGLK